MLQSHGDESEDGPPHARDLGRHILSLETEIAREADQPVTTDSAQEDLMPLGSDLLELSSGNSLLLEDLIVENATI